MNASQSPTAWEILAKAGSPVRLRILVALETREQSTAELAEGLGVSFNSAESGIRRLIAAGLVEVVRVEQASRKAQTMRRVYGNRYAGWQDVRDALEAVCELRKGSK